LITGTLLKTQILSANHYEHEILHLLASWDRGNPRDKYRLDETLKRLDKSCFAHFCLTGECVSTGISVLRLLSVLSPCNNKRINEILVPLIEQYNNWHGGMAAINHIFQKIE